MPNTIASANMNMPVPVVGVDPGPDYATDLNSCITILDSHDHSSGFGVQITPAGININSDLTFNTSYNAIAMRSVRFTAQSSPIATASDLGCLSVSGVDLYYRDVSGNSIRITSGGAVAGTPGSISGLSAPASASYSGGSGTFIFQSGANIPGNLDGASIVIRDQTLASNGVTISAPVALAANYTISLPAALPAGQRFVTLDNSGNMAATWNVDNSTLEVSSNSVRVKDAGITLAKMASNSVDTSQLVAASVTRAKMASVGQQAALSSLNSVYGSSGSYQQISNQSINITTTGRPVMVLIQSFGSANPAKIYASGGTATLFLGLFRDGSLINTYDLSTSTGSDALPIPSIMALDAVGAGTYAYDLKVLFNAGSATSVRIDYFKMVAYEL